MENSGCSAKIRVMLWAVAAVAKRRTRRMEREMVCRSCIFPASGGTGGDLCVGG